jgi:hypothetical protein
MILEYWITFSPGNEIWNGSVDFDAIVNENEINIYASCEGRPMNVVHMRWMKWTFCNL